jgi:hypothetical protein
MFKQIVLLFLIIIVWMMISCSPERKLAKQFVDKTSKPNVLLLMPSFIFMEDLKLSGLENDESDTLVRTLVLDKIEDSVVINRFRTIYINKLERYGVFVYEEKTLNDFMKLDSNAWVVNIAQIELQEYETVFTDSQEFFGVIYSTDVFLNGLNSAFWFEFSQVNAPENNKPDIMFAANDLYDKYDGRYIYDIFSGQMKYNLEIDTLNVDDFYRQIDFSAKLYAGYTFDYLMNIYISSNIPDKNKKVNYYRYDPYRDSYYITPEDKFIPLNE